MPKLNDTGCVNCGGHGNLLFISDGKTNIVRHASPFECIQVLNERIEEINEKIRKLDRRTTGLRTIR